MRSILVSEDRMLEQDGHQATLTVVPVAFTYVDDLAPPAASVVRQKVHDGAGG